jgi:hypothetical protein
VIVKNKLTPADRAFWAHCEAVAREVSLWPAWMRGEVQRVHTPFAHREDGSPITGLKRCANCGLSETYWERWPDCKK